MEEIKDKDLLKFKNLRLKKVKVRFDEQMLNSIIAFIYKDSVLRTRKTLQNIQKLFMIVDDEIYEGKPLLQDRIWVVRKSLSAILDSDFENTEMIKQCCLNDEECDSSKTVIINMISTLKISHEESRWLIKQIEDRLQFGFCLTIKEVAQRLFDKVDASDYKTYKSIMDDINALAISIVNGRRNIVSAESDTTFSLQEDVFENVVSDSVTKLKDRDKILTTGIRRLNTILAPGYLSKRLYTYLAFPGGGKSQILLKSALDIKKYNGHVKAKDPDKNPAVLYITMENDIDETVERIFNMVGINDDIRNYTPKQVIKMLKKEGNLTLTEKNNIDIIIKYYPNRSIDTNDLYSIIKDLDDSGSEVIALILDYVKRIRPAEAAQSEKEELKNITNELKTLAKTLDIPVITAQQLNRAAASVVDAAIQAKKEDVTRLVGRDGIAGAWEIIENSDWVCILNQETKTDTEALYMTFKLLKRRYRSSEDDEKMRRLEYFNHPYNPENQIQLIDDVDLPKPVSLYSLASDLGEQIHGKQRGKKNAVEREKNNDNAFNAISAFGVFDSDESQVFV